MSDSRLNGSQTNDDRVPEQTGLRTKVLYYPYMGTDINTERLILLSRLCYSPMGIDQLLSLLTGDKPSDEKTGEFIRNLMKSGHWGPLEHWYTTFAVEGYSRVSSQQNDRHRLMKVLKDHGVVYHNEPVQASPDVSQLQQSQRYVKEDNFRYITPPSFASEPEFEARFKRLQAEIMDMQREGLSLGLPAEDVRFALSNATETRFVITTNARQLRHMFNLRCCQRAQWEIREMFTELLDEYRRIAPNIFYRAGASCVDLGYCPEGKMSCGRAPTLEMLQESYKKSR